MDRARFKALQLHRTSTGSSEPVLASLSADDLPPGPVTVAVHYSSINFKDGLAVTDRAKIIRGEFPFVPGIDLAGEVVASTDDRFTAGDRVVGTGGGLGETIWGGFSELARPDPEYLVHLPDDLSYEQAMGIGTAGFTAMLAVMAFEREEVSTEQPVLVTGASGGVGSMAVALLASRGYTVEASTGKEEAHAYLRDLGAARILHRDVLSEGPARPMDSAAWGGAVDTVGGTTLASVISKLGWHGTVAVCGNASGAELQTTVYPFILRGTKMIGIDSNTSPVSERVAAWRSLAAGLQRDALARMYTVIDLDQVADGCEQIIRGAVRGRLVVRVNG